MSIEESEQLQEDIITYCNELPQELIDKLCQIIVNWQKNHPNGG